MRHFNLGNGAVISSLALLATLAGAGVGCGTGSDSTNAGAGGTPGNGGSTATGGTIAVGTGGTTGTSQGGSTGTPGTGGSTGTSTGGTPGTGTGGSTGTPGTLPTTNGVCKGAGTRALTVDDVKVDNFEDTAISPGWSTFNDVDVGGMKNTIKMTQEAPGAVGTAHFAHYAGKGAKTPVAGGYGVGTIYNAAIDKTAGTYCVDVTAFDGLTFWAKAAKAGSKVGVNFVIPETNMAPDGDCTTGCYNHPQRSVTLTTDWAQYSVPFSAAVAGTAKVMGRIQMLGWLSPDTDWDFSIDEIQFYKGTPPTTAVPTN